MSDVMFSRELGPLSGELLRHSEGYARGLSGAHAYFDATQSFDPDVVGSIRVKILDGRFMHEQIDADDSGDPCSKVFPLAEAIAWREMMVHAANGSPVFNRLDFQAHLMGFSDKYNELLVEKHRDVLDRITTLATMATSRST